MTAQYAQRRSPARVWACWALVWLAACGAVQQAPTRPVQAGDVRAAWQAGLADVAAQTQATWLAGVRAERPADADALRSMARWHLQRENPAQAWQVLTPLFSRPSERTCVSETTQLAAKVLVAWHPESAPALGLQAAPVDAPPQVCRTRWVMDVAAQLFKYAPVTSRGLLDAARRADPGNLALWAAWLSPNRAPPTPEMRTSWLAAVGDGQGAPLTLTQLQTLAVTPPVDPRTAAGLRWLAAQRPDATDADWFALAMARLRADDLPGLRDLAQQHADHFQTPRGQVVLARALLGLRQVELVRPMLLAMPQDDAWTLLLQSEVLRQTGLAQQADLLRGKALEKATDRSEIALVAAQLMAHSGISAQGIVAVAANQPGTGQWAAMRMRALDAVASPRRLPQKALTGVMAEYARALTMETPEVTILSEDPPVDAATARAQLIALLEPQATAWQEAWLLVLKTFADANVADGAMLRELALRALREDDAPAFLTLDARARELAQRQGVVLANDKVLQALGARTGGSVLLARWLRDAQVQETSVEPELAWTVATTLLKGHFTWAGRQWAADALARTTKAETNAVQAKLLVVSGAPDLALELLARWHPEDSNQEAVRAVVTADAQYMLDRPQDAAQTLLAFIRRPEAMARQVRALSETAFDHGQCDVVIAAVPKLMSDREDLASWRSGVQRGLDCARRLGQPAWMELVMESAKTPTPDPTRIDALARELTNFGYHQRAAGVFESLNRIRPLLPDTLVLWAKSLLFLGQADAAVTALTTAVTLMHGRSTIFHQRAGELLEDFGELTRAEIFWSGGLQVDADNPNLRYRRVLNHLRRGETADLLDNLTALLRVGPANEVLDNVTDVATRAGQLTTLAGVADGAADVDRDTERFRLTVAARLGQRSVVEAGVRRLRAKRAVQTAQVPAWLLAVGSRRLAREMAEDLLASAEPTGAQTDRPAALRLALKERRDPTSDAEALTLTRDYVGRALEPQRAAMEAAVELARVGLAEAARAVSTMTNQGDHPLRMCMQATFEHDAGHMEVARALWQKSMAGALLDPRTREYLRMTAEQTRDNDNDETALELQCVLSGLSEAHEFTALANWFRDLLVMVPDSALLRSRLFHIHLMRGDVPAALAELQEAAQTLSELREKDWRAPCERLLRDGGGPALLAWLAAQGPSMRCEPWFLAFASSVLESQQPEPGVRKGALVAAEPPLADAGALAALPAQPASTEPLQAALAALAPVMPALRIELALRWSARGRVPEAVAVLGDAPLWVSESPVVAASGASETWVTRAAKAVAAVAIAVSETGDARALLTRWLAHGRGNEVRALVARELVLQGHPELALVADPPGDNPMPDSQAFLPPALLKSRAMVGMATLADDVLISQWSAATRGVRTGVELEDEAVATLLRAGRVTAALALARVQATQEPGLRPHPLIQPALTGTADGPAILGAAVYFRPDTLTALTRDPGAMDVETQLAVLRVAVAREDAAAMAWTRKRELTSDETWRPWWDLTEEATAFERWSLATDALGHALAAGMPAGLAACRGLTLGLTVPAGTDVGTQLAHCLRHRALDALEESELADLAAGVGLATDPSTTAAFWTLLRAAPQQTQANFLSAAATRITHLEPAAQDRLRQGVHAWLDGLPPVQHDSLIVIGLDDLAALGLGALGVEMEQRVAARDPRARSERNNLAYAQFLAGGAMQPALTLALQAAYQMGGEAAYATLDTVACVKWALGDHAGALEAQARALVSAALAPRSSEAGLVLPLVRHAEFLLATGRAEEARTLAAFALQKPDEPGTALRARRVLIAALRSHPPASTAPQPATP